MTTTLTKQQIAVTVSRADGGDVGVYVSNLNAEGVTQLSKDLELCGSVRVGTEEEFWTLFVVSKFNPESAEYKRWFTTVKDTVTDWRDTLSDSRLRNLFSA